MTEQPNEEQLRRILEEAANAWVDELIADTGQSLHGIRDFALGFRERLIERWGYAFDLFEIALNAARQYGESFNIRKRPVAAESNDPLFEVLIRLHARACLTASEVLVLLKAGHASGALARWRTLHELAVIGFFVRKHGRDSAEKFLLHNIVESYKIVLLYQKHYKRLEYEPPDESEIAYLENLRNELVERFGSAFLSQYGWASDKFGHSPTLSHLEKDVGLDHMRPHYKMASHGIHAGSKGVMWNIGVEDASKTMLAGPSNSGLADPGHASMISLNQITVQLLSYDPDVEDSIAILVLQQLVDLGGDAFFAAHKQLEEDQAKIRQQNV